jgi:pimeloyl-ACP methyl ester carboxylesterase
MTSSAEKMFKMFFHHPVSSRSLLRKAISVISPLLRQMQLFGYAICFQLPSPFIRALGTGGNFSFLKYVHKTAYGKIGAYTPHDAAEAMASTMGPSPVECKTLNDSKDFYPDSVLIRAKTTGEFFVQQTALYRDDAIFDRWTKSLETIAGLHSLGANDLRRRSSSGAGLFDNNHRQTLKQKATFVWGQKDPYLVESLVLHGIGDYLPKQSQVVLLPRTGHFTPIEKESRRAFEKVLEWIVCGEKEDLGQAVEEVYHGAVLLVNK